jgi:hypothetical protein
VSRNNQVDLYQFSSGRFEQAGRLAQVQPLMSEEKDHKESGGQPWF